MSLSKEDELADLFEDVLKIAGSPEKAKSELRAYLRKIAANPPPLSDAYAGVHPDDPYFPATGSLSSVLSSTPSSVSTVTTPSSKRKDPVWGKFPTYPTSPTPIMKHEPTMHRIPTANVISTVHMIPTTNVRPTAHTTPTVHAVPPQPAYFLPPPDNKVPDNETSNDRVYEDTDLYSHLEDIRLTDPGLVRITLDESTHTPEMFRYIKLMISRNPSYLGEASLDHYPILNGGFSKANVAVPEDPELCNVRFWYAVSRGRSLGIFIHWPEAAALVDGCSGNVHQKFKDFRRAVLFMQAALLKGTLLIIPRS